MLTFLGSWFVLSIVTAAILCRIIHKAKILNGEILVC